MFASAKIIVNSTFKNTKLEINVLLQVTVKSLTTYLFRGKSGIVVTNRWKRSFVYSASVVGGPYGRLFIVFFLPFAVLFFAMFQFYTLNLI